MAGAPGTPSNAATISVDDSGTNSSQWAYSTNSGSTWSEWIDNSTTTFNISEGTYDENVIQIKNKDVAGNESTIVKNSSSFTIDRTATTIIDISTNKADGTYKEGEEINITLNFSENVNLVDNKLFKVKV